MPPLDKPRELSRIWFKIPFSLLTLVWLLLICHGFVRARRQWPAYISNLFFFEVGCSPLTLCLILFLKGESLFPELKSPPVNQLFFFFPIKKKIFKTINSSSLSDTKPQHHLFLNPSRLCDKTQSTTGYAKIPFVVTPFRSSLSLVTEASFNILLIWYPLNTPFTP